MNSDSYAYGETEAMTNTEKALDRVSIPAKDCKWEKRSIEYKSILGTSDVEAYTLAWDGPLTIKPSEEERLARWQASRFMKKAIAGKLKFDGSELRYILMILELKQADLARALDVSPSTISNFVKGEAVSSQTYRQMSLLLKLELEQSGFLSRLERMVHDSADEDLLISRPERLRA
jgi:DNA-binding transcriptional regulator YiaG